MSESISAVGSYEPLLAAAEAAAMALPGAYDRRSRWTGRAAFLTCLRIRVDGNAVVRASMSLKTWYLHLRVLREAGLPLLGEGGGIDAVANL